MILTDNPHVWNRSATANYIFDITMLDNFWYDDVHDKVRAGICRPLPTCISRTRTP